jgi:hypothetical protein
MAQNNVQEGLPFGFFFLFTIFSLSIVNVVLMLSRSSRSLPLQTSDRTDTPRDESHSGDNESVGDDERTKSEPQVSLNLSELSDDTKLQTEIALARNEMNGWRCVCQEGFLPPGLLKSFGTAEAMVKLGTGQCYHKQA